MTVIRGRWARAVHRRLPWTRGLKALAESQRIEIAQLRASIERAEVELDDLRAELRALRTDLEAVRETAAEGRRLGRAAARSVDLSLQNELLVRRDVDSLLDGRDEG